MTPPSGSPSAEFTRRRPATASRLLATAAVVLAGAAVAALLAPNPLEDVFFAGIVGLSVPFALVGALGAWTNRTPLVWVAAVFLTGLSILGLMSVGLVLLPAALSSIGAAACSQLAGPRSDVREAIIANPPSTRAIRRQVLVGVGSVVVGLGAVSVGAFGRGLFGSCARETLACALETTDWVAVGLTVLGLAAVVYGGWLLWRQAYVVRVLSSAEPR